MKFQIWQKIKTPKQECAEGENGESNKGKPKKEYDPEYDPEYLKVTDRVLAYLLYRRYKVADSQMLDEWKEGKLNRFLGLTLLDYNSTVEQAIDVLSRSGFQGGDWAELIEKLAGKTTEELLTIIEKEKSNGG